MKNMKLLFGICLVVSLFSLIEANCQWAPNGGNIYNTNTGFVGIGNNSPTTLLHVQKSTTEPTITIQNLGGNGGATYTMIDNASGANWKFKATLSGGFKIRDHSNLMDVIVIEPNSFANAIYIKSTDNIGIGTAAPASSALVDMSSVSKGFLVPRMDSEQMGSITDPVDGLLVYNTSDKHFYYYSTPGNTWNRLSLANEGTWTCGTALTVYHSAGPIAPVSEVITYNTLLTNVTGNNKCWIKQNLGAANMANSVDDNSEASAGWYWQFNRIQGFRHDGTNRLPGTTWIIVIDEDSEWLTANDPCSLELGSGWRIPTYTEWNNADANGGWTTWSGPWNSTLKIHAAGDLSSGGGLLSGRGIHGRYWSGNKNGTSLGWALNFNSAECFLNNGYSKSNGFSLRCIRNE